MYRGEISFYGVRIWTFQFILDNREKRGDLYGEINYRS